MDVSLRLAIAVVVICAPTLLFLGLWHGLTALRDDDLAGEMSARQLQGLFDTLPSGQPDAGRFERVEVPDGGIEGAVGGRPGESESAAGESDGARSREATIEGPGGDEGIEELEIGVETDPIECSRCAEPNPPAAELCWGCGGYLNGIENDA